VIAKAGYISDSKANTIWLSGILKTDPGNDRGVIDHKMLDERFGTIESLKAFSKKLMKAGEYV
jgi:glycosidase